MSYKKVNEQELTSYYGLVYYLVNRYFWEFNYQIRQELIQYGIEGLWFALRSYDEEKGCKTTHISYAVLRECRKYLKDFYKMDENNMLVSSYDADYWLQDVIGNNRYEQLYLHDQVVKELFKIVYKHCKKESHLKVVKSFVNAYLYGDCKTFSDAAKEIGISRQYINRLFRGIAKSVTPEEKLLIEELIK